MGTYVPTCIERLGRLHGQKTGHCLTQSITPVPQVRSQVRTNILSGHEVLDAHPVPNGTAPADEGVNGQTSTPFCGGSGLAPRNYVLTPTPVTGAPARLSYRRPDMGPFLKGPGTTQTDGMAPHLLGWLPHTLQWDP